jgi:hypothetical protein
MPALVERVARHIRGCHAEGVPGEAAATAVVPAGDNPGAVEGHSRFAVDRMEAARRTGRGEEAVAHMARLKAGVAHTERPEEDAGHTEHPEEAAGHTGRPEEEEVVRTADSGDTAGFGTGLAGRRAGEAGTGRRVAGLRVQAGSHSTAAGTEAGPALGPVLGPAAEVREVGIVDRRHSGWGAHPEAGHRSLAAAGVDRNKVAASSL